MGIGTSLATNNWGNAGKFAAESRQRREQEAKDAQGRNVTMEWLKTRGANDLIPLVASGEITPMQAIQMASQTADMPTKVKEFLFAQKEGFTGGFMDFLQALREQTNVNVNNSLGGPNDGALRKKLDENTGEQWASYQSAGAVAGQLSRDLDMLDEIGKMAPQGPIEGRLAQAFPGASSAAAAFQAIVKRVAPSLRQEGSGSTSDIEYQGFLDSLPALQNMPDANLLITQVLRSKAQIDIERSNIVAAYSNGEISAADARSRISELDRREILTPEIKQRLIGIAPQSSDGFQQTPSGNKFRIKGN